MDKTLTTRSTKKSVRSDITFLKTLEKHIDKSSSDSTSFQYAKQMVNDWINELKSLL